MKITKLDLLFILFFLSAFSRINSQVADAMPSKSESIMHAANHYLTVLSEIGDLRSQRDPQNISQLCVPNCKKVRNGKVLFEQTSHFAEQLTGAKEWLGSWAICPLEIMAIPDSSAALIRYELITEKEGRLLVFVILRFDENFNIYEINEVHNKIDE